MQTATVEVTFVKEPAQGKQYGSIKGADNVWWPVKMDRIREFEAGNAYELAYTESDKGFKNIIGVKKIVPQAAPQGNFTQISEPKSAPKQNGQQYYQPRPTSPKDSERMWTCAILGHIIDHGAVDTRNEEAMIEEVNKLRRIYQATYGQDD
jgi:hypothetical protein